MSASGKMTLLERAREVKTPGNAAKGVPTEDELDLACEYANGHVTARQVSAVVTPALSRQNGHQWCGSILLRAYRAGMIVRAKP